MVSYKEYRFQDNPKEQEFFEKFVEQFKDNPHSLSGIIFGWGNDRQTEPKELLTEREMDICANLMQWLGSPVGQGFLDSCGFTANPETK